MIDDADGERMILPDYLQRGLNVVFCGTAVGDRSAARGRFFAGPTNKFWRVLHKIGLTPVLLTPEDDRRVVSHGIGLTDLVKHHSGNDDALRPGMYDVSGFERKILDYAPRFVAFNGKKGAAVYLGCRRTRDVRFGLHERSIGSSRIFVLPSTSGSAGRTWDESVWHELANLILGRR